MKNGWENNEVEYENDLGAVDRIEVREKDVLGKYGGNDNEGKTHGS